MRTSIIVPVYNSPNALFECLTTLKRLECNRVEIIVVDDGCTDKTALVAEKIGCRVLKLARNSGPAAARNHGARNAQGEILFFVDADMVLAPDALSRVEVAFEEQPDLAAVFGSYDAQPRASGIVSQYRNLLHHFVHQNGRPEAFTFWAGCGAIRRSVFEEIGGFDEKQFLKSSIEDIELGYRLRQAGHRILLDKTLQGTHLKRWNLWSLIQTDITCRAIPWSRLILQTQKAPDDLNLKLGQRVSLALVALACILLLVAPLQPKVLFISVMALLAIAGLNRDLYAFFFRQHGLVFVLACIPLHLLYYLYSGLCYCYVWADFHLRNEKA